MHALAKELLREGHTVSVVTPQVGCESVGMYSEKGVRFYLHPSFGKTGWRTLIEPHLLPLKLKRFLDSIYVQDKPDVVLSFNIFYVVASKRSCPQVPVGYLTGGAIRDWYSWISTGASRLGRYKWSLRTYLAQRVERKALVSADAVFAEVRAVRVRLQELHRGARVKCELWPTPVDKERFKPNAAAREEVRAELGIAHGQKLLLCVGRLQWNKNFKVVIEALNAIRRDDFHLLLVGQGDEQKSLQQLAAKGAHSGRVTFIESRQDMERVYAAADIFVHPALVEPYGNVVQEALASGIACMVSGPNFIGFSENLTDEANALLVDPHNVSTWATKLDRLLSDAGLRRRLGASARELIESRPGWPELTQILLTELGIRNPSILNR